MKNFTREKRDALENSKKEERARIEKEVAAAIASALSLLTAVLRDNRLPKLRELAFVELVGSNGWSQPFGITIEPSGIQELCRQKKYRNARKEGTG